MRPFFPRTATFSERMPDWQACLPALLLVPVLVAFVTLATVLTLSTDKAKAAAAPTHTISLTALTMIDQRHGWSISPDSKHVFFTSQGPEHWIEVTPSLLTTNSLTSSFFLDATHGYLAISQNNQAVLLSTRNSGKTWETASFNIPIISNPVTLYQITFLDFQHGWLAFNRANTQPGSFNVLLMNTSNGGKTWQTVFDTTQNPTSLPLPYSLSAHFSFTTPKDGWVTGIGLSKGVYFYATHDGGKTWKQLPLAVKGSDTIDFSQGSGPFWQNHRSGTLFVRYDNSAVPGTSSYNVTAFKTYDGGKTWTLQPSLSYAPSTAQLFYYLWTFADARNAWFFGPNSQGQYHIDHTSNGGTSWSPFLTSGLPAIKIVDSLTFLNATTGWLILSDTNNNLDLLQTNNGGHTWHLLHPVVS